MNLPELTEQIPVCWLIGPNVAPSVVEHLCSMGLQVELAEEPPEQAQWFVPSSIFCLPDYEPRVFRGWRPTGNFLSPRWPSGQLLNHNSADGWSEEKAGRTVSALNLSSPYPVTTGAEDPWALPNPPAVMLLTKDWTEADQLLEMASNARLEQHILASPSVNHLAELASEFGQIATVRSPFRLPEEPLPWGNPELGALTLTSIDLLNPHAFSNAIGHAIWLLSNDPKQRRRQMPIKRKAWGHMQNFHPKLEQVRLGLLLASQKDANLARELVAGRPEMVVLSWEPDAFGKFIVQVNPRRIFFESSLIHFPEWPRLSPHEDSELSAKLNVSLCFSGTDLAVLPPNWKTVGLESIFQESSSKSGGDPDPIPFECLFSLLQQTLSTASECRFQFHLDGGWTVETAQAAFQWSPSRELLRAHIQGKIQSAAWKTRISTDINHRWLHFCTHVPQAHDDAYQPIVNRPITVYQKFSNSTETPNQRLYSGPVT